MYICMYVCIYTYIYMCVCVRACVRVRVRVRVCVYRWQSQLRRRRAVAASTGTQFTCCTSTKVQILTQKALQEAIADPDSANFGRTYS